MRGEHTTTVEYLVVNKQLLPKKKRENKYKGKKPWITEELLKMMDEREYGKTETGTSTRN